MIEVLDAEAVGRLEPRAAVDALEAALREGLDPDADPPRSSLPAGTGELLVMPAGGREAAGVKLVTVGGRPRVQGVYVLFDGATLAPVALLDGPALTALRTAAVSALAVRHLAAPGARRLLIFGTGPQARAHRDALGFDDVTMLGRGDPRPDVGEFDVVCCCTTAREPLFDGNRIAPHATVVAIGSHEPAAREVDERLARRATVVVESRAAALREAGDVIAAGLGPADLRTLAELVRGRVRPDPARPGLFKSVGMAWEDLVVARAVLEAAG